MPNWAQNILTVSGPSEQLHEFVELVAGVSGDLTKGACPLDWRQHAPLRVVSRPPGKPSLKRPCYEDNISLAVSAWGTKWLLDADDITVTGPSEDGTSIKYEFATAWSPPVEWMQAAGALHPELFFELFYAEGSMGFSGRATVGTDGAHSAVEYQGDDAREYLSGYELEWMLGDVDEEEELELDSADENDRLAVTPLDETASASASASASAPEDAPAATSPAAHHPDSG